MFHNHQCNMCGKLILCNFPEPCPIYEFLTCFKCGYEYLELIGLYKNGN